VSLYKTFCHVNMTASRVEEMFLYHAGLEAERLQLKAQSAANTRIRCLVERYHLLKHGIAPRGLRDWRDRDRDSRALQHRF
jgi:hypothetical protein